MKSIKSKWLHSKVFVAWGRGWAFQAQLQPTLSLGVRLEPLRPMVDFYFGPFTLALGKRPVLTDGHVRYSDSCRGYVFSEMELL